MKFKQKRIKLHIKKDDTVKVLSGNYKNKKGKVLKVLPKKNRAFVAGINIVSKHIKPSEKNQQSGIKKQEAPIHISNLMYVDLTNNIPTRIGRKYNEQGKLQRYANKTGEFIK